MRFSSLVAGVSASVAAVVAAVMASAQDALQGLELVGKPISGNMGFQPAVTSVSRDLQWLDGMLLYACIAIVAFVTLLLAVVAIRFNRRTNPTPATFTHNSPLEITWTIIPIIILVFIGAFSLPVLFAEQEIPKADLTIKATGHQWYWSYEYVDSGFGFDSFLVDGSTKVASLGDSQPMGTPGVLDATAKLKLEALGYTASEFLLATDTAVVVPVNKIVVMQLTGADVIHGWYVPAFGVQQSAVPGRLSELWFNAEKEGVYFGQCTSLCGKSHAYMPITVKVVSQPVYDAWLAGAKAEFAGTPLPLEVADNN